MPSPIAIRGPWTRWMTGRKLGAIPSGPARQTDTRIASAGVYGRLALLLALLVGGPALVQAQLVLQSLPQLPVTGRPLTLEYQLNAPAIGLLLPPILEPELEVLDLRSRPRVDGSRQVELVLIAAEPGRYVIPPLRWAGPQSELASPEVLLEVRDSRRPADPVPERLRWLVPEDGLVVGQTGLVTLELVNMVDPRFPDQTTIALPQGAIVEEVVGLGAISSREIGETELFDVPVATFLVTPTAEGSLAMPRAEATLSGVRIVTRPASFPVRLDDRIGASGAVGDFRVNVDAPAGPVIIGRTARISITLEGTGNLDYLSAPEFSIPGATRLSVTEQVNAAPTTAGYQGRRTIVAEYLFPRAGQYELRVEPYRWLEPESDAIRLSAPLVRTIEVVAPSGTVAERQDPQLQLIAPADMQSYERSEWYREPWVWALLLPGPGSLLVLWLLARPGRPAGGGAGLLGLMLLTTVLVSAQTRPVPELVVGAFEEFQAGRFSQARAAYLAALDGSPADGPLHFNLGVLAFLENDPSDAIFHLRTAVRFNPSSELFRSTLTDLERRLGLDQQWVLPFPLHPAIPVIVILAIWNGIFVILAIPFRRGGSAFIVVAVLCIFLIGASVIFGVTQRSRDAAVGVVDTGGGDMKRIPDDRVEPWLEFEPGAALKLGVENGAFTLVRTTFGVEGWMRSAQLRQVRAPQRVMDQSTP